MAGPTGKRYEKLSTGSFVPVPPTLAAAAVTTAGALPVFLTGALSVQIRTSLSLGEAALGIAVATFFASAAALSILGGKLTERWGESRIMVWATLLSAVAMVVVAVGVRSWTELVGTLIVGGAAYGVAQPATNVFLTRFVTHGRLGWAFGVKQAAIPVSTLLGGLAVPVLALTVGWRWAFMAGAGSALLAGRLVPRARHSPLGQGAVPTTSPCPGDLGEHGAGNGPPLSAPLNVGPLVILALALTMGAGAANALGSFVVPAAVDAGVSHGLAGLLAALGSLAGLSSRLLAGWHADRREGSHLLVVAAMMVGGSVGYLFLASGIKWLLVPGVILAFGAGWGWAGLMTFAVVRTHPKAPGRATAIVQTGAYTGGFVGPLVFGFLAQHFSYDAAWATMTGAAMVAAAGVLLGSHMLVTERLAIEPQKRDRGKPQP